MQRRTLLGAGLAATLARPALVRAEAATTLKFVPYADLALLGACCTIAFGNVVMTCFGAFRC